MRGKRRNIASCLSPEAAGFPSFGVPRRRLSNAMGPEGSPSIVNRPIRVYCITSGADIQHTMASQSSRRAASASEIAFIWGSINNMVTMIMSPSAIASLQSVNDPESASHSVAAKLLKSIPGKSWVNRFSARAIAPLTWLSSVTRTTFIGVASSVAEVCFRVIERVYFDSGKSVLECISLRVSPSLSSDKKWNLFELLLGFKCPDDSTIIWLAIVR